MINVFKLVVFLLMVFFSCDIFAAQDALINVGPQQRAGQQQELSTLAPGAIILMPDGRQAVIMEQLANGDYITDLGINISSLGLVLDGESKGQFARLDPEFYAASVKSEIPTLEIPSQAAKAPVKTESVKLPKKNGEESSPISKIPAQKGQSPSQAAVNPGNGQTAQVKPENIQIRSSSPENLTLAELLPMTNIKTGEVQIPHSLKELPAKKTETPEKKPQTGKPESTARQANKTPPTKAKTETPKKESPKQEKPGNSRKPKAGEEMKIPPEAIKSGNLDFLEGCWQGTRPEYYSKRIVRECFCFGTGGKSGKRRIYDHGRMCIGGTRANLSSKGILSVTSTGAACNDGERWGSAEMICQNSGPKTPCSWIFRDANNGHQSYTIPFVRVESCGR